jgi:hypothetical protein
VSVPCVRSPKVDPELGFLNGFVQQALANGASPYLPPEARTTLANPLSKQVGAWLAPALGALARANPQLQPAAVSYHSPPLRNSPGHPHGRVAAAEALPLSKSPHRGMTRTTD